MEQDWIKAIPSLPATTMGRFTEEVQKWIKTNNQQRLQKDKAVQGSSDTDSAIDRLVIDEEGEGPHPDCDETTGNPV